MNGPLNGTGISALVPETDAVKRIIAIGVGDVSRGDEGVGPMVVRAVRACWPEAVRVFEHGGEGASLMRLWTPGDGVFLFGAVSSGRRPGTLYRFEATQEPLPRRFFRPITHPFGVAEAVEAARAIKRLPKRMVVYGVEGEQFGDDEEMSDLVRRALKELTSRALAEIRSLAERALALHLGLAPGVTGK